jgi:mono/diheme cytochrome c family protein
MRSLFNAIAILALVNCGDDGNKKTPDAPMQTGDGSGSGSGSNTAQVERGRYIMNTLGACTFCHTPLNPDGTRDNTRLFAGVDCLFDTDPATDGSGCVSSRNLTNDATGLMNATATQIKDAFRNGHRTDGKTLAPIMPYWIFHNMTDDDADSIVAYLRTVPGVSHTVQANEPPWSDINDSGSAGISPYIMDSEIPMPTGGGSAALNGRYLATKAGLCIDCHTPDAQQPSARLIDLTKAMQGGRVFPKEALGLLDPSYPATITTRNLTPDATGLQGWTMQQIEDAIAKGKDQMGNAVCAATHGSMISPYAALTQADLDDITTYVMNLPPAANDTGSDCAGPPVP